MKKIFSILFVTCILILILLFLFISSDRSFAIKGKIVGALPNTSWINSTQEVLFRDFSKGGLSLPEGLSSIYLNGENRRFLYDDVRYVCFSPEGERIAIITYSNAKDGEDIIIFDVKSKNAEIIENNKRCSNPVWTPDGTKIVYISEQDHGLVVCNIVTKDKKAIKMTASYPGNNHFVISHAGDRIIYQDYIPGPGEYMEGIFQYDINSGEVKNLSGLKKDMPNIFNYISPEDIFWGNGGGDLNIGSSLPISPYTGEANLIKKDGSLYINRNGTQELLAQYEGPLDVKFNRGVENYIWLPDEKFVLFNLYDSIYVVDVDAKKIGVLCKGCSKPVVYYSIYKPYNEKASIEKGYSPFDK